MNKKTPQTQTITLPNGKEVLNLAPEDDSQLAIVHLRVVKRLAALLPKADFNEIRNVLQHNLNLQNNLDEMITLLKDEVAFHETVNLITLLDKPEQEYANV